MKENYNDFKNVKKNKMKNVKKNIMKTPKKEKQLEFFIGFGFF